MNRRKIPIIMMRTIRNTRTGLIVSTLLTVGPLRLSTSTSICANHKSNCQRSKYRNRRLHKSSEIYRATKLVKREIHTPSITRSGQTNRRSDSKTIIQICIDNRLARLICPPLWKIKTRPRKCIKKPILKT